MRNFKSLILRNIAHFIINYAKPFLCFVIFEFYFIFTYVTPLHFSKGLSVFETSTLTGLDFLIWFTFFFLSYTFFIQLPQILIKNYLRLNIFKAFHHIILFIMFTVFIFFYFIDWLFFGINDSFFGLNTFIVILSRPVLMFKHALAINPKELLILCGVSLVCGFFLTRISIRKPSEEISHHLLDRGCIKVLKILLMSFLVLSCAGLGYYKFQKPEVQKRYWQAFYKYTSPLTILIGDFYRFNHFNSLILKKTHLIRHYNEQIPLEDYVKQINKKEVKTYNVLLILVESLRTDQLQAFGGFREVMPGLEQIAEESFCFLNSYAQSSHSDYSDPCPMSSHYPLRGIPYHIYPKKIYYPNLLIYDVLKELGYRTAIISSQNEYWGNIFYYLNKPSLDYYFHSEVYDGETYVPYKDEGFSEWVIGNKRAGKIDDRYTVEKAVHWLKSNKEKKPFFMYLNVQNSHSPFQLPDDFPKNYSKDIIFDFPISFAGFPKNRAQDVLDKYADTLSYVDAQLTRLFAYLKKSKLWGDTIIIVSGDTGQAFYEHGFVAHGNNLFDETVKVPIIFRVPGQNGWKVPDYMQHIDIPPTLFHFMNIPVHPGFQGENIFEKDPEKAPIFLVSQAHGLKYAVILNGWKLIYNQNTDDFLLFDLKNDPKELNNLAYEEIEIRTRLFEYLREWIIYQVHYYKNKDKMREVYPPFYKIRENNVLKMRNTLN